VPVQFFQGPALVHEGGGEVIEEGELHGRRRLNAEVARLVDERFSEVVGPDAVDDDAGGEGIVAAREGLGELKSTTAPGEFLTAKHGEVSPGSPDLRDDRHCRGS